MHGNREYIIDNNVFSILEGMIRTTHGRRDERRDKVDELVTRLNTEPSRIIVGDFALLEAAQFASTDGLRADTLVLRKIAYQLLQSAPDGIYDAAATLEGFGFPDDWDRNVDDELSETIERLCISFVPAYAVALLLEHRLGAGAHDQFVEQDVLAALQLLSDRLDFVPLTLWMSLVLASCGTQPARATAMGTFKTGRRDHKKKQYLPGKNALSAAWDLASLQSLSERIPSGAHATLVTEDKALAQLVGHFSRHPLGLHIRERSFDSRRLKRRDDLEAAYGALRGPRLGRNSAPSRDVCADLIEELEHQLGAHTGVPAQLRKGPGLRLPTVEFLPRDLDRTREFITDLDRAQMSAGAPVELTVGSPEESLSLFNALLRIGAAAAQIAGEVQGSSARGATEAVRDELDERESQYALAMLDYIERADRPIQWAARYGFMTHDQAITAHLRGLIRTVLKLTRAWMRVLGHPSIVPITNQAVRVINSEMPLQPSQP